MPFVALELLLGNIHPGLVIGKIEMRRGMSLGIALLTLPGFLTLPADAGILKQGAARSGYYWQQVSTSKGSRWLCRKAGVGQFQKHAKCNAAGAIKP